MNTVEDCVRFDGLFEVQDAQYKRLTVDLFHWELSGNFRSEPLTSLSTSSADCSSWRLPFSAPVSSVFQQVRECSLLRASQLGYCALCQWCGPGNDKSSVPGWEEATFLWRWHPHQFDLQQKQLVPTQWVQRLWHLSLSHLYMKTPIMLSLNYFILNREERINVLISRLCSLPCWRHCESLSLVADVFVSESDSQFRMTIGRSDKTFKVCEVRNYLVLLVREEYIHIIM